MHDAFIALGGNVGAVLVTFRRALKLFDESGLRVVAISPAYRTVAWVPEKAPAGPDYWNAVCQVSTGYSPVALLRVLQQIETRLGRIRRTKWAARTLDLDLLLYDDLLVDSPELQIPHPGLATRPFVLQPLVALNPDVVVPIAGTTGKTARDLAAELRDPHQGILERVDGWFQPAPSDMNDLCAAKV